MSEWSRHTINTLFSINQQACVTEMLTRVNISLYSYNIIKTTARARYHRDMTSDVGSEWTSNQTQHQVFRQMACLYLSMRHK